MQKKQKISILILLLTVIFTIGYFGVYNKNKPINETVEKEDIETISSSKIVQNDKVASKNDLVVKESAKKQSKLDVKKDDEVVDYSLEEALKKIKYIDYIGNKFYKKDVDISFVIDGNTYLLKDHSKKLGYLISRTDSKIHAENEQNNYDSWNYYLTRPHPSVKTLNKYFEKASFEFKIPLPILYAIAMREKNWTMTSPSIDQGWGLMHLTDNGYSQTLNEASKLINLPPEILKKDALHNIRGAAALLAKYNNYKHTSFIQYDEWIPSLKKITGLNIEKLKESQVKKYLNIIYNGSNSKTLWGEEIILSKNNNQY
jgi:hypothetical protein